MLFMGVVTLDVNFTNFIRYNLLSRTFGNASYGNENEFLFSFVCLIFENNVKICSIFQ